MLPRINSQWRLFSTWFVIASLAAPAVALQETGLPDARGCIEAFAAVRRWVNDYSLPDADGPDAAIAVEGATAAYIAIRRSGRLLGEGHDHGEDALLIRRAAQKALRSFNTNEQILSFVAVRENDLRDVIAREATIEVEIAGEFIPLIGDTFEDLGAQIRPGLDGFALRSGEEWLFRFPAQLRASNNSSIAPGALMQTVLTEMGLRRLPVSELRDRHGLSIYRFETVDLAQRSPDGPPFVTFRGSRPISNSDVDRATLIQFAEVLADHLIAREWQPGGITQPTDAVQEEIERLDELLRQRDPNLPPAFSAPRTPLGILGAYHPTIGMYRPLLASPFEQALASYALSRFARRTPGVAAEKAGRAAAFAEDILYQLADVVRDDVEEVAEADPRDDPLACAMIVLAGAELIQGPGTRSRVAQLVMEAQQKTIAMFSTDDGAFHRVTAADGSDVELPPAGKALLAAALARLHLAHPELVSQTTTRAALDAAWAAVDEPSQLSLMPWIGYGEYDYAMIAGESPRAADLRRIREMLLESQLVRTTHAGRDAAADLAGGFQLAGAGGAPAADAQGIRPAAWIALLLQDRQAVTDVELPIVVGRMMQFARFLMQLTVTDDEAWAYPEPGRAVGGVCNALWDSTQTVPAEALALVTVSEILKGLSRFDKID